MAVWPMMMGNSQTNEIVSEAEGHLSSHGISHRHCSSIQIFFLQFQRSILFGNQYARDVHDVYNVLGVSLK